MLTCCSSTCSASLTTCWTFTSAQPTWKWLCSTMVYASIFTCSKRIICINSELFWKFSPALNFTFSLSKWNLTKYLKYLDVNFLPDTVDIVPDLANNGIPPLLPLSLDEDVEVYRNLRILKVLGTLYFKYNLRFFLWNNWSFECVSKSPWFHLNTVALCLIIIICLFTQEGVFDVFF